MDISNKQVRITRVSSISLPMETVVNLELLQEISPGIKTVVNSFEMVFDQIYGGPNDPQLLLEIQSRLAALP